MVDCSGRPTGTGPAERNDAMSANNPFARLPEAASFTVTSTDRKSVV